VGEEVHNGVGGTCNVLQSVIEVLQEFDPVGLSSSDLLWFPEVLQIFVICQHAYGVLRTQEEGSSTFESEDDAR